MYLSNPFIFIINGFDFLMNRVIRKAGERMKYKRILILFSCCCILLSACSTEEDMKGSNNADVTVVDKSGEKNTKQEKEEYAVYSAKISDFPSEVNPDMFFPTTSDYKQVESDEDEKIWNDSKDNYLLCQAGYIFYNSRKFTGSYDNLVWDDNGKIRENYRELFGESKIKKKEKAEITEKVSKILDENRISVSNIDIYYLTAENLEELSNMVETDEEYEKDLADNPNDKMKRDFDKTDELYVVTMDVTIEDKVLYKNEFHYGSVPYPGSTAWAVYDCNQELLAFSADGIYQKTGEVRKATIMSEKDGKKKFKEKYKDLISKQTVELKELSLLYIPVKGEDKDKKGQYSFIPAYVFTAEITMDLAKENKDSMKYTDTILLDAELGKWIE